MPVRQSDPVPTELRHLEVNERLQEIVGAPLPLRDAEEEPSLQDAGPVSESLERFAVAMVADCAERNLLVRELVVEPGLDGIGSGGVGGGGVRLGLDALALTDHDGLCGVARLETAAPYDLLPVFGAEPSLDLTAPQNGVADLGGRSALVRHATVVALVLRPLAVMPVRLMRRTSQLRLALSANKVGAVAGSGASDRSSRRV